MKLEESLTANFKLVEFCKSAMANSLGIDLTKPPSAITDNLKRVAVKCEQARAILNCKININSGWRPKELNEAIGGSKTSAHIDGLAVDMFPKKAMDSDGLHNAFFELANDLEFMKDVDQLIMERGCIHLGLPAHNKQARRELRGEVYQLGERHYPLIKVWGA